MKTSPPAVPHDAAISWFPVRVMKRTLFMLQSFNTAHVFFNSVQLSARFASQTSASLLVLGTSGSRHTGAAADLHVLYLYIHIFQGLRQSFTPGGKKKSFPHITM